MNRWHEPYRQTRRSYAETLGRASASTEALERARAWKRRRPVIRRRVARHVEAIWNRFLGGRTSWNRLLGVTTHDPRLARLRREELAVLRKKLKRLRDLPRSSGPAQRFHLAILYLSLRLFFTRTTVAIITVMVLVLLLQVYKPNWIGDLIDLLRSVGPGP